MKDPTSQPLAIVGVSALFPGSSDVDGFWRDITDARDLVGPVPPQYWLVEDYHDADPTRVDKTYASRGAFLDPIDFDPLAFGIPPSLMESTDTAQLLALIVAQKVLEDATRNNLAGLDRERVSVILGVTSAQELLADMVSRLQRPVWVKALRESGLPETEVQAACERISANYVPWTEATFPGLLGNVVAGRIANRLDLHGTNCITDAACASTFSALSMAANELYLGSSDLVITGGVDTMNGIFMHMCFSKTPALSRKGDCRPFDAEADGTLLGEGMAMFALRRLADAERDGDRVYAVLRGIGSSSDGRSKSVYAPVSEGQARALRRAYEKAGYGAETVELVEAHGTGTKAGDAAEFGGLKIVFDETGRVDRQWCALGSVKSQIGHTKAAAGAAGLFKIALALRHRTLPPTAKISRPNPALDIENTPFYLNTETRPWVRGADHPRRASVSSFGFGGSNFHLTVEEYVGPHAAGRRRTLSSELLLLGATDGGALADRAEALANALSAKGSLRFAAWKLAQEPATGPARLSVVAANEAAASAALRDAAARLRKAPTAAFSLPSGVSCSHGANPGRVAFLFPGQGSQYVGMGSEVARTWDEAIAVWDRAATLGLGGDQPIHHVVFPVPVFDDAARTAQQAELTRTDRAQPAIGLHSASLLGLITGAGVTPHEVAGHSFGEVTALHAAGVLSTDAFLAVAAARGQAMAEASSTPGAMCAVRGSLEAVQERLAAWSLDLVVANHNHPTQVVLSGAVAVVEEAIRRFEAEGLASKKLDVGTAFHSPIVAPAAAALRATLTGTELAAPRVPVLANATAEVYPDDVEGIRDLLALQLTSSVRFVEVIEALHARGVRTFVEVGPQAVLTGLVDRILGDREHRAIATDRRGKDGVVQVQLALGELFVAGCAVNPQVLWSGYEAPVDPASLPKPKMSVPIAGWNVGKPYPPAGGAPALPPPNPPRPPQEAIVVEKIVERIVEVPVAAAGAAPVAADGAWLGAFQEIQRQTAEAHAAYQDAMARSHEAFLLTAQQAIAGLTGTQAPGFAPAPVRAAPVYAAPAPVYAAPAPVYAAPAPVYAAPAPVYAAPAPVYAAPAAPAPVQAAPAPHRAPPVATPAAAPALDLTSLLLAVVADKTGYPTETLQLSMDLEADLGVDSIKRVEILSAMRERAPGLPEVDPNELAKLHTLQEIVTHLGGTVGSSVAPVPAAARAPAPPASGAVDLTSLLLAVVADKTGYPTETLQLSMDLEADLGVDSIKRVEILSAMRERAPGLPEVDPNELAKLHTLQEIVTHLGGAAAPAAAVAAPAAPAGAVDLTSLLLAVVADKTGYPTETLQLSMDLEADLGVDSIKRVEILSAMRERAPGLPEVDPNELAKLHTLQEIVTHLGGSASPIPAIAPLQGGHDALGRFVVELVAAPANGLGLPGLLSGEIQVAGGPEGLGLAVVQALVAAGGTARRVSQPEGSPGGVILLHGIGPFADRDAAISVHREAFVALKAVAAALVSGGGVVVSVQDTGGMLGFEGSTQPWASGLPGLVKTFLLEAPKVRGRALDLARGSRGDVEVAQAIVDELRGGGTEVEVAIDAAGVRRTPVVVRRAAGRGPVVLGPKDVVVASGGARGVTAATLVALAKASRARFVLLGRTALAEEPVEVRSAVTDADLKKALVGAAAARGEKAAPAAIGKAASAILAGREVRATLAAIASAGGEARYVAADVQDARALAAALAEVRSAWGPITALVHGAGVLADRYVVDKTAAQVEQVVDTKVRGLAALLDATASDPLRAILLFSSVAARTGNTGQCDYAMANEVLNKVAHAEAAARPGCVVRALGWGPWKGGMVTSALEARFDALGVPMIPLDVGAAMLVDELRTDTDAAHELVLGGEPKGALLGADTTPAVQATVAVNLTRWPVLADHQVRGAVVVPIVLAVEWMLRAARACRPDLVAVEVRKVEVLRGLRLPELDARGVDLALRVRQLENGTGATLLAELDDASGRPAYRAQVRLENVRGEAGSLGGLPSGGVSAAPVYDGELLFHGPQLQVLRTVAGLGADLCTATLVGQRAQGWSEGPWELDVAALDGLLQLGVAWGGARLGGANLPLGVEAVRLHQAGPVDGPLHAVLKVLSSTRDSARIDLFLARPDGRLVAELRGAAYTRVPDAPAARPSA